MSGIGTLDLNSGSPSMGQPDTTVRTFNVLQDVARERQRQDEKWGEQSHHPELWLAILTEEVGEVAKELADASVRPLDEAQLRAELIQVAAVAVSAVETLDYGAAGIGRTYPEPGS